MSRHFFQSPILAFAFIALAGFVFSACRGKPSGHFQGYIEGEYVYVSAPVSGRLEKLDVSKGNNVQAGQALFTLENTPWKAARDEANARLRQAAARLEDIKKGARPTEVSGLEARLAEAKANFDFSKKEFDRLEYLYRSKASAQNELDKVRSAFDQSKNRVIQLESELATAHLGGRSDQVSAQEAEVAAHTAALAKAEWQLAQSSQTASVAGSVTDTLYRVGEWVDAGRPVLVELPPTNVKARTFIPERFLSSLHLGDSAKISIDGESQDLTATVRFIAPNAEYTPPVIYSREIREKLVYLVELSFEPASAEALHPGQPIEVHFGD